MLNFLCFFILLKTDKGEFVSINLFLILFTAVKTDFRINITPYGEIFII